MCVDNREEVSLPESQRLEDVLCSSDMKLMRKRQSSKGVYIFQPLGTGPVGPWPLGKASLLILLLSRVWWETGKDTGKQEIISFFSPSHFLWTFPPFPPPPLSLYFFCLWLNLKVSFFLGGGSKIPANGDYSHEIKRCLLLGRKVMTNLDSILKSIDITLSTKVYLVKAMVFPVVMYGCESWTIKKAELPRIDASELWYWRRLLRAPWTARRSNQSTPKEISPGCSLEGLMLKLKLNTLATWCKELTHWKRPWCL